MCLCEWFLVDPKRRIEANNFWLMKKVLMQNVDGFLFIGYLGNLVFWNLCC